MENKKLILRITDKIKTYRKRTERIVGFVPYSLYFEIRRYLGTSQKPERVSVLENTIVKLVNKKVCDIKNISECLGLNIYDAIEKDIVSKSIENLIKNLKLLEGTPSKLSLTSTGKQFISNGNLIKTFSRHFEIYVSSVDPSFTVLNKCADRILNIKTEKKIIIEDNLTFQEIKNLAEYQASFIQYEDKGIQLESAGLVGCLSAKMSLYVCFIQSIRDNSIRTIIYEESSDSVIEELSQLFDRNEKLRDDLLAQCLKKEVKADEAVKVQSGEKSKEQIATETKIIQEADSKGEDLTTDTAENYNSKVGTVYDSSDFERELYEIFETHQNDEIWLISPWIKRYAFIKMREPMIRKFLDQGGTVFIGYSEPERIGEEMVDPESMSVVEYFDANYDRFYYAELPKFHYKNVIEHNKKVTSLYTGSFNILSFCINGSEEHYRMEQMTFVNHKEAIKRRQNYLQQFGDIYINRYISLIDSLKPGSTINIAKLEYLKKTAVLEDKFSKFKVLTQEANINIKTLAKPNENDLAAIANKLLEAKLEDDNYHIQARLAAMLFLFILGTNKNNQNILKFIENEVNHFLVNKCIYNFCRFVLKRGRIDPQKSVVYIICNGLNFEFGEINLQKNSFIAINKHKETIYFKEENIKLAKFKIGELLYNSAKALGLIV